MRCNGQDGGFGYDGDPMYGSPDPMYGQSGEEGGPLAYPCQDLVSVCGIGVVRVGAVLQGGC